MAEPACTSVLIGEMSLFSDPTADGEAAKIRSLVQVAFASESVDGPDSSQLTSADNVSSDPLAVSLTYS